MCCLNSNLQILRHIPEFLEEVSTSQNDSALLNVLNYIFSRIGTFEKVSAAMLRQLLGEASNQHQLSSGAQHDTVEILSFMLDHCPNELFYFETKTESRFKLGQNSSPCPECGKMPRPVPAIHKLLQLELPQSHERQTLINLLKKAFSSCCQGWHS